jgi:hypothetical protein
MSGLLPAALLFAALGLALAFTHRRNWVPSLLAMLGPMEAVTYLPLPHGWSEGVLLGCWISVIATAASMHLVRGLGIRVALALSLNTGVWAGAVTSLYGSRLDVLRVLPAVLILLPASWVAGRYTSIAIKVVSSWIIAVAVLAATLQFLPVTPGYLPDHME